jgi:hypothetical protein
MRGFLMNIRIRATLMAIFSLAAVALTAPGVAQANPLSILPGSCGNQVESQPFARWGDNSNYTPVTGGAFEPGSVPWALIGAHVEAGNESYYANVSSDNNSLLLPSGSSAISPPVCASVYHPTLRLFVSNSGSASSRLKVEALYPGLLGGVQAASLGELSGTATWQPSPVLPLTVANLLATLSLQRTAIAYRFTPQGAGGQWRIDDVYLDPRMR